jgi:DNA-directed RNA polymerase specialized sigma24 family protein
LFEATAVEPGPDEAVVMVDQIEMLLRGLPPLYAELLDLRLQGIPAEEIGSRLNISRRTVYRALTLLQQRLSDQALLIEEAGNRKDS